MQKGVNVFDYYDEEKRKALLDASAADPDKDVKLKNVVVGVLAVVVITVVMSILMAEYSPQNPSATPAPPTQTRAASFTDNQKDLATSAIEQSPEVIDSHITQSGGQLSLVLIVSYGTSVARAKQLGENFVRSVKTFSPDENPGRLIGQGRYDYMIGVYYPNEKQVALGAKAATARNVAW